MLWSRQNVHFIFNTWMLMQCSSLHNRGLLNNLTGGLVIWSNNPWYNVHWVWTTPAIINNEAGHYFCVVSPGILASLACLDDLEVDECQSSAEPVPKHAKHVLKTWFAQHLAVRRVCWLLLPNVLLVENWLFCDFWSVADVCTAELYVDILLSSR